MKKTVLILWCAIALTGCKNPKSNSAKNNDTSNKTEDVTPIGGEKDEHGCLSSAGETWSQLQQDCIRVFNVGERLNPTEAPEGEAIMSAFIVFNDDQSKAELFLPNTSNTIILKSTDKTTFESDKYKFDPKDASLYINGEKAYRAPNKE